MERSPDYASGQSGNSGTSAMLDQAKQQTQQVAQKVTETAGNLTEQAKNQLRDQTNGQLDRAAGALDSVAQALRQSGDQLRNQEQAAVGECMASAAQMVERASGYLHEHRVEDVIEDVESMARRQPMLFIGGALALGFFAARFLKSSTPSQSQWQSQSQSQHSGTSRHPDWMVEGRQTRTDAERREAVRRERQPDMGGYTSTPSTYGSAGTAGTAGAGMSTFDAAGVQSTTTDFDDYSDTNDEFATSTRTGVNNDV